MTEFEWDATKAASNLHKHGVPFPYATGVFDDPHRLDEVDTRRSYREERRRTMGMIDGRLYVVVYTYRQTAIRIISARKANGREERQYRTLSS
jgi:uncharacterized DUF497 family protein